MQKKRYIERAYGDDPLDRILPFADRRETVVLNPSYENTISPSFEGGVKFPKSCFFEPDDELLGELRTGYESKNRMRLEALWAKARPLAFG